MIKKIDISLPDIADRVLFLQKEAYTMEAELVNYYGLDVLNDDVEDIMWSEENFYGYFVDGEMIAFISYKLDDDILDIIRLAVAQDCLRHGIATKLIKFIEDLAIGFSKITIHTRLGNMPAEEFLGELGYDLEYITDIEEDIDEEIVARDATYEKNLKEC